MNDEATPSPAGLDPWPVLSQDPGADLRIFRVRTDVLKSPLTQAPYRATILETPDWVNVVAVTEDRHIVLIRQFRFGAREHTLEIPGGMVDEGEEALEAAQRELREESGYTAEDWRSLGCVQPNPAFHDNRCHTFLARNARCTEPQRLDPQEQIQVLPTPIDTVRRLARDGTIQNSLVVVALARVLDLSTAEARIR